MSQKRGGFRLVREIADYVIRNYGVPAYKEIVWREARKID